MLDNFKNRLWRGLKLHVMPLLVLMLLCVVPAMAEEKAAAKSEDSMPVMGISEAAAAAMAPCRGLKPFKEMDELVYQIYINLDSDCMFKMDPMELAEIWGIPTLWFHEITKKSSSLEELKKTPSEGDHKHLKMSAGRFGPKGEHLRVFSIELATQSSLDGLYEHQFFPNYAYPKLIPPPLINEGSLLHAYIEPGNPRCDQSPKKNNDMLYWYNSDKTKTLLIMTACGMSYAIKVYNYKLFNFD